MNARNHLTFDVTAAGVGWSLRGRDEPSGERSAVPRREAERIVAAWLRGGGVLGLQLRTLALRLGRHTLRELPDPTEAAAILRAALRDGVLVLARGEALQPGSAAPRAEAEAPASAPPPETAAEVTTWIEVRLVDEAGEPVPDVRYRLKLPDGTVREGRLDARGLVHLRGVDPGACEFTFPDLDADAWAQLS